MNKYQLLDSGGEEKLEAFGPHVLRRPSAQAPWRPTQKKWTNANATFVRDRGWNQELSPWELKLGGMTFKLKPNEFGHVGIFPEHEMHWKWMEERLNQKSNVLNLFAYTGGATLACAKAGAKVCHLDASKKTVNWAKENTALNSLQDAPIRYITDDAVKFMRREVKRGSKYDGIILDPPTFGRGPSGELFKIEKSIQELLELCKQLLTPKPQFILFTSHTPGFTPTVIHHLLVQHMPKGKIETGEMFLKGEDALDLPSGSYGRWSHV